MLHRFKIGILITMFLSPNLFGAIISVMSPAMATSVAEINTNVAGIMAGYQSKMASISLTANLNKDKYEQRKENIILLHRKNKEVEIYLQALNFEFSKNKDLEALRKKDQNILLLQKVIK